MGCYNAAVNTNQTTLLRIGGLTILALCLASGCEAPKSKFTTYPPGTLPVPYQEASAPSSCLVASVSMAANYLLADHRLAEPAARAAMKEKELDEAQVVDVKKYLADQGLDMIVLSGRLDGKPTEGLRFWVEQKGYPAICIINRHGEDPKFNHAVVVTGFSGDANGQQADIVYYLDPSTREPLQFLELAEFDRYWARGNRAMLLVVAPPTANGGPR